MQFFETLIFTFLPVIIDRTPFPSPSKRTYRSTTFRTVPVAVVVLWVRYGALIVSIVMGVSLVL